MIFGNTFSKEGVQTGHKKYLSYSAIQKWLKSKEEYRDVYYKGQPYRETEYTIFGSRMHQMIEDGELAVKDHPFPQYTSEMRMYEHIRGVPVLGYIDLIDEETLRLSDTKTGIMKPDGSPRWTQSDVQKLDQLPFYQLLVAKKYGKVSQYCGLIWLVTEFKETKKGIGSTRELILTGEQHVFKRRTAKWERERMADLIEKTAHQITKDYAKHN